MIDIETYCEICDSKCEIEIKYQQLWVRINVTCPGCAKRIDDMTNELYELEEALYGRD